MNEDITSEWSKLNHKFCIVSQLPNVKRWRHKYFIHLEINWDRSFGHECDIVMSMTQCMFTYMR